MPRLRLTLDYDPAWPKDHCQAPECHDHGCTYQKSECPDRINYQPMLESEDILMRLYLERVLGANGGAGEGTGYNFKLEIIER